MTDRPSLLEELRGRLSTLEEAQHASGRTADPGFWTRLTRPLAASSAPITRNAGGTSAGPSSPGTRVAGHARREAPESRPPRARFGPWASVPLRVLHDLDKERLRAAFLGARDRTSHNTPTTTNAFSNPFSNPSRNRSGNPSGDPSGNPSGNPSSDPPTDPSTDHGRPGGGSARQSSARQPSAPVPLLVEAGLGASLHRHDESTLTRAAEWVAHQRATLDAMLVNLIGELESRGAEAPDGLTRTDWLRRHDPSLTPGAARTLVTVGAALAQPRWGRLAVQVTTGQTTVSHAREIIEFHDRTHRLADPDDLDTALADLHKQALRLRPEELARVARHHTEQIRPPRDHDDESVTESRDEARRLSRGLWFDPPSATGMVSMRGRLDPEAAAIVKSAIDPLSRPCPAIDDHGHLVESDPRSPATRRMDALIDVVARGAATPGTAPDGSPARTPTDKAKVVVLIDHDSLVDQLAPRLTADGEPLPPFTAQSGTGRALSGDVLTATTIRRIACDAGIIPVVLGSRGEPLDVGREKRLVTPGLRLALIARDRGCSYPGCTVPPQWTDAHHVVPWISGGKTSLLNAALLCRRHHTHVHRYQLTATVTASTVTWHT